jgi:hypothetical protein
MRGVKRQAGQAPIVGAQTGSPASQLPGVGKTTVVQTAPMGVASTEVTPPLGGINQTGFIDTSDGAHLRTGPAETNGVLVLPAPLPPATRVFVSGTHPHAPAWWYVTAFLPDKVVRGYVQQLRVNTDLPEPLAKLHEVKSGDTVEKLAVAEYASAVRDGHDLRYYENVLLHANQQRGRAGIAGTYQAPGALGGGTNNIQLVAGHRIWLVSPAYAHAVEGAVPDGSLTGGAVAQGKRFALHIEDIVKSITQSPSFFGEVDGEYAQAIRDHMAEIIGVLAGFVVAEGVSMFLAATPTGVGQAAAIVIQLALSTLGAAGLVQASVEAAKHAEQWLTVAWMAKGKEDQLAAASREFLRMLVSVAMAALSYLGAKSNFTKALKIQQSMPPPGLVPAVAAAGGRSGAIAAAGEGVKLGTPGPLSPVSAAGSLNMKAHGETGGGPEAPTPEDHAQIDEASFANNAKPPERVTAGRVAARPELKGRVFRAPPAPDPGYDWVDDLGRTYDAMGDGTTAKYFKFNKFKAAIDHHLMKGNTFTVIDMTGYTQEQISQVRAYVDTLPAKGIIRVGF